MKKHIFLFGIFSFLLVSLGLQAQFYNTGQDRASLKWLQIKQEHFKIIYPVDCDSVARHLAAALQWSYDNITKDMRHKPRRIGVIIHPEASESNGIVTWAPKRMEIFTTPPMDAYPHDWFEQLALHEYRHVVQIDKMNQGLTRFLFFLFGEQAVGGVLGAYIPLWFLEGDAVYSETRYSATGRGREVSFLEPLKVQVLDTGVYHMDKATYGSYKDFVPGPYELGYAWVSEVNRQYGDTVWPNVLNYVARNPYLVIPFTIALKKQTGLHRRVLYNSIMDTLQQAWLQQVKASPALKQELIQPYFPTKDYRDYSLPTQVDSSSFIAIKRSYDHIPRLVKIRKDEKGKYKEEKLRSLGYSYFYNLGFNGKKACWSEFRFDPRWDHRRYNVIMTMDLEQKKAKQITRKTNYFFPEYHPDGKRISCLEIDPYNHYAMVLLDGESGDVLTKHNLPYMAGSPLWDDAGKHIYFVGHTSQGHSLARISMKSGEIEELLAPDYYTKDIQWITNDSIFFTAEYKGAENLFAYVISKNEIYQFTESPFGLTDFCQSCNGNWLYTYPDVLGRKVYRANFADYQPKRVLPKLKNDSLLPILARNIQFDSLPPLDLKPKKYRKALHMLNFHSWGPISISGTTIEPNPSIAFSSQNLLGTATTVAQQTWNIFQNIRETSLRFTYEGWYPKVDLNFDHIYQFTKNQEHIFIYLSGAEMSLPLNFTRSRFITTFQASFGSRYQQSRVYKEGMKLFDGEGVDYTMGARFRIYQRLATRSLKPRWGIDMQYLGAMNSKGNSEMQSMQSYVWLPGIGKHHSLQLYGGVQWNMNEFVLLSFNDVLSLPRYPGYDTRDHFYALKFDYTLPLAYPDWSLGPVFYFKRVRLNLLYDQFWAYDRDLVPDREIGYSYAGLDALFEGHAFRLITPVNWGLRVLFGGYGIAYTFLFSLNMP